MIETPSLAGGKKGEHPNTIENKALLKIHGKYMIEYVMNRMKKVPQIDKILVVIGTKTCMPPLIN